MRIVISHSLRGWGGTSSMVLDLARNPQQRDRLGSAGPAYAQARFGLNRLAKQYEAVLPRGGP